MASLHSMGTLHLASCTGGTEGSRWIVYTPGILPVVSNDWGNIYFKGNDVLHIFYSNIVVLECIIFNGLGGRVL